MGCRQKTLDRFERSTYPEPNSGCHLWAGATDSGGYGTFYTGGRSTGAHRSAYALYVGPIPEGSHVCHTCDVRACVNPDHLFTGTRAENMADMVAKNRADRTKKSKGSDHYRSRLSEEDIPAIRLQRSAGATLQEVADTFGVSRGCISRICRNETWKHV